MNDKQNINKNKSGVNKIKIFMVNNNMTANQGSTNGNTDPSSKDKENFNNINNNNAVKNCITKTKK